MKITIFTLLLLTTLKLFSQEESFFFEEDIDEVEESNITLQLDGSFKAFGSSFIDYDDIGESDNSVNSDVDLNLLWESEFVDLSMNIDIKLEDLDDISDFPLQGERFSTDVFFDTLFVRFYHSNFDVELGLLKPVWGNADAIHVIDVLNPLDYSVPFGPSYLDRKISQQMLKFNIPLGNSLIEAVYLPTFEGDNIPVSGRWTPYYIKTMEEQITANSLSIEDPEYLEDSQVALRFSTSINSIDIGGTYFWGFLKQPTIDMDNFINNGTLRLIYNRVHVVGLDLATQVGKFNVKGEFALNLTEDYKGDDPSITNSSINYIVGFDINLPINNINFLIQGVGSGIINSDEITESDPEYRDDDYVDFALMTRVSDNYINETLFFEVAGAYDFFNNDFMLIPESRYKISDNLDIFIEYLILHGDKDTDFGQYRDNDRITIGLEYFY